MMATLEKKGSGAIYMMHEKIWIIMRRSIVSLLIVLSGLVIASCNSRHVAEKPDTTRPTVIAKSPDSSATGVAVNAAITVTFSEAMNASTIDTSFYVVKTSTTTTLTGTITYDAVSNVATLTTTTLEYGTSYTATVTTNVKDAAGNALGSPLQWSFTTLRTDHLDTNFGSSGIVRKALGSIPGDDIAYAAAIQPGGEIIIAGLSAVSTYLTNTNYFTIARFLPNGMLDTNFSPPTGYGVNNFFIGRAYAVTLQSDGKIVAAGSSWALASSDSDFLIARYNSDGSRDMVFGTGTSPDGSSVVNIGAQDTARAVAIQADGKIIVAGDSTSDGGLTYQSVITRLTTTGILDTSFGTKGIVTFNTYTISDAYIVKVQADQKILVGGIYKDTQGLTTSYLTRVDSSGTLDPNFGLGGIVTVSTGTNTLISGMEILPSDGKILVAGTTTYSTDDLFLMRFDLSDGSLNTTFGSNGIVIADDIDNGDATAAGLAIQADGKIIIAASYRRPGQTNNFALFRFHSDGMLDTTFGAGFGMVTTNFGSDDYADDVLIQQDGKIIVIGKVWNGSYYNDIGLARYWP